MNFDRKGFAKTTEKSALTLQPKLHAHLVSELVDALQSIFFAGEFADKIIKRKFKMHRQWGSRDRRFYAESVYEITRWWRQLWYAIDTTPNRELVPLAVGAFLVRQGFELPSWDGFEGLDPEMIQQRLAKLPGRALKESIPDWLDQLGDQELGARWPSILTSLNESSTVYLRTNTLKIQRQELMKKLRQEEVETLPVMGSEIALSLPVRKNVFSTKAFQDGFFEMQDLSSQKIAPMLRVQPGQRVVDACAGAGGKTLHLAALMKNQGRILSLDVAEWKLEELQQRVRRDGVDIVETRLIDTTKVIKRQHENFDRVLLDVPCSGLGVLRRNPDKKWKLTAEELENLKKLQQDILRSYCKMAKVGGLVLYATCSILPSENEQQIEKFMKDFGHQWRLLEQLRIDPDQGQGDGFYAALLERVVGEGA